MKIADIRKFETGELAAKSTEIREEIVEMKRRLYMGEIQNTRSIRVKRRDLARIMTVLSEQLSKESM